MARRFFSDGNLGGNAVHRAGGRENKFAHLAVNDRIEQGNAILHVVLEIFSRDCSTDSPT